MGGGLTGEELPHTQGSAVLNPLPSTQTKARVKATKWLVITVIASQSLEIDLGSHKAGGSALKLKLTIKARKTACLQVAVL